MRNLKKALALVVVFTMMLTLFAGISTASAASDYSSSVARAQRFGIMKGDGTGDLKPFADVTRAEFMTMLVRALGYEDAAKAAAGATKFADVPANHWASGYVNVAVQLGVTKGKSDGAFAPDDKVTVLEALAMIERAMGYEVLANEKGGWPTGYLVIAKDRNFGLNLLDGVSEAATMPAPRGLVAKLFDNALDAPFWEVVSYEGGVPRYTQNNNVTFLTKMGYDKLTYVGTDGKTKDTFIVSQTPFYGNDEAKIDLVYAEDPSGSATFKDSYITDREVVGDYDLDSFIGKRVKVYIDEDNDDKIVDIQLADTDKTSVVVAKEISDDSGKLKIKDTNDKETKYELKDGIAGIVANWTPSTGDSISDIVTAFGSDKELYDVNVVIYDGKVDFVYGFKYNAAITAGTNTVVDKSTYKKVGSYVLVDGDDAAKYTVTKNGKAATLADIEKDNYVYVAQKNTDADANKAKDNRYNIVVVNNVITGKFNGITYKADGTGKDKVKIGSTLYTLDTTGATTYVDANSEMVSSNLDKDAEIRLNRVGEVAKFKLTTADADTYAIILDVGESSAVYGGKKTKIVKLLKSDGTTVEVNVHTDLYNELTGVWNAASKLDTADEDGRGWLIKYGLDADGKLKKIDAAVNTDPAALSTTTATVKVDDKKYTVSSTDKYISDDLIIFNRSEVKIKVDERKFEVLKWADLVNDSTPRYLGEYADDWGRVKVLVLDNAQSEGKENYAVIKSLSAVKDAYELVVLMSDGEKVYTTVNTSVYGTSGKVARIDINSAGKVSNVNASAVTATTYSELDVVEIEGSWMKLSDNGNATNNYYVLDSKLVVFKYDDADANDKFDSAADISDVYVGKKVVVYTKSGTNTVIAIGIAK